jgi:hypothetical protein
MLICSQKGGSEKYGANFSSGDTLVFLLVGYIISSHMISDYQSQLMGKTSSLMQFVQTVIQNAC